VNELSEELAELRNPQQEQTIYEDGEYYQVEQDGGQKTLCSYIHGYGFLCLTSSSIMLPILTNPVKHAWKIYWPPRSVRDSIEDLPRRNTQTRVEDGLPEAHEVKK